MAIVINGSGTITGISAGGLPDGSVDSDTLATGIDATKLADGTVTSTELQYINTLASNAQTQISAAGGGTTTGFLTGLSSTINNVTGDGTLYSWTGATYTDIYDDGTNFTSGTFTAPVTGKYMFIHNFYTSTVTSSHTMCQTNLVTSNRTYVTGKFNPYNALGGGSDISFQAVFLADMDASDTASVSQKFENGAMTVDYYSSGSAGTAYTYFVGALVHE